MLLPFRLSLMSETREFCEGEGLLRGARRISQFIFGTENQWRAIYSMAGDLPIFRIAGSLVARPQSLARAITERERTKGQQPAPSPEHAKTKHQERKKRRR